MNWQFSCCFWIRSAGFPFNWLESLGIEKSQSLVEQWSSLEKILEQLDEAFTGTLHNLFEDSPQELQKWIERLRERELINPDTIVFTSISTCLCLEIRRLIVRRNTLIEQQNQLESILKVTFAEDTERIRQQLLNKMSDPLVEEALFLSNREVLERIRSLCRRGSLQSINARTRQRIRLAWSYLQRFCSKNDTTSFFGPLAWGQFSAAEKRLSLEFPPGPWLRKRLVFFEHWAVQALANAISQDANVAPFLPLQLNPGCKFEEGELHYPINHSVKVNGLNRKIFNYLTTPNDSKQWTERALITALSHEKVNAKKIEGAIHGLIQRGVLYQQILIPTAVQCPEDELKHSLLSISYECPMRNDWLNRLEELLRLRVAFENANLEERIQLLNQLNALFQGLGCIELARESGSMYAGRYILYEDCERNIRIQIGRKLQQEIETALTPILNVYRSLALAITQRLHKQYLEIYRTLLKSGNNSVDFLHFYQHAQSQSNTNELITELRGKLKASWARVLPSHAPDEVLLHPEELDSLASSIFDVPETQSIPLPLGCDIHSPDLLLAATSLAELQAGNYQIIIGEVHPGVHTVSQPVAFPFCPFRVAIQEEVDALLAPATMVLVDPPATHQRSNINWPVSKNLYEVVMPGCASRLSPDHQIPVAQGRVIEDEGRLRFVDSASGRWNDLFTVMPGIFHKMLFELACDVLGGDYPSRLVCGRIILKRRSWLFQPGQIPDVQRPGEEALSFATTRHWSLKHGMPRWVFLKSDQEPKPIFVDFDNPLAVDLFKKYAAQASHLRVSEMRPSPEELWLRDERGAFTYEIRTTLIFNGKNLRKGV